MALFNSPIFIIPSVTFMMMLLQNTAIALLNPAAEAMIIDDSTPKIVHSSMQSIIGR